MSGDTAPQSDLLNDPDVLALLREMDEVTQANPLQGYIPHPRQQEFHESKASIKAFFGGNRSGKTHCSIADDVIQAIDADAVPEHLKPYKKWQPPFKCWIGCPKFAKLEEAILPKLRELIPRDQLKDDSFDKAYDKTNKIVRFKNGSVIGFKTYDQDVDAFSSADLHRMHWDEEPEGEHGYKIRQEARARLIDYGGDEIFSMTPLLGLSFVYEEVWERRDEPNIFVVRADMDDNPHLNQAAKEEFLSGLTDEERKARKEGKFVHFRGMVYPEFADKHIIDPPDREHVQGMEIVVGIDPGYRTTAVVFAGFDKNNGALIFDELYLHKDDALPGPVSEQIRLKCAKWGIKPQWYYIDPMATNASLVGSGENIEGAYFREGIPVIKANNKVEAGILEVKRRLQSEYPALLISKECQSLLGEIRQYRLDDRADGKFEVVKVNDHACDAMRYLLMGRVWWQPRDPAKPKHPTFGERPDFEPPYREQTFIESVPPLGTYS